MRSICRPSRASAALVAVIALALAACATVTPLSQQNIAALLAAPDRTEADRQLDARRKPAELISFTGLAPGMRVLDLGAGGGYSSELVARAVGPAGRVHVQIAPAGESSQARQRLEERLKRPIMQTAKLDVLSFDNPVAAEISPGSLDAVTFFFGYHDIGGPGNDRARMNRAIFDALKPGGVYVIIDHSGRPGTGGSEARTLHRIEEAFLRREVEGAGFRLEAEASFLRNPTDPRDKPVFRPTQPNDEFVLRFVKPRQLQSYGGSNTVGGY